MKLQIYESKSTNVFCIFDKDVNLLTLNYINGFLCKKYGEMVNGARRYQLFAIGLLNNRTSFTLPGDDFSFWLFCRRQC